MRERRGNILISLVILLLLLTAVACTPDGNKADGDTVTYAVPFFESETTERGLTLSTLEKM